MKIRAGYTIAHDCPQPTPMILALSVHPSRARDMITPDRIRLDPFVPMRAYRDQFGNVCHLIHAPADRLEITNEVIVRDSGVPDEVAPDAPTVVTSGALPIIDPAMPPSALITKAADIHQRPRSGSSRAPRKPSARYPQAIACRAAAAAAS